MAAKGIEQRHLVLLYQSAVLSVTKDYKYNKNLKEPVRASLVGITRFIRFH